MDKNICVLPIAPVPRASMLSVLGVLACAQCLAYILLVIVATGGAGFPAMEKSSIRDESPVLFEL